MGDIDKVCNVLTFHPKNGKKGQKRVKFEFFEKSQNLEKNMIFFQVYPLCTPFTLFVLFCKKIAESYIFSFINMPVKALIRTLPLF